MYLSIFLAISLLLVLNYYGIHAQGNVEKDENEQEEEDLIRYYKEDNYKPPLFGSNAYDPVKDVFETLKHQKQETNNDTQMSDSGSTVIDNIDVNEHTSTTHSRPKVPTEKPEKVLGKTIPPAYFRHSIVHQNITPGIVRPNSNVLRTGLRNNKKTTTESKPTSKHFLYV